MGRVKQSKRRVNSIIPHLLRIDFLNIVDDWWFNYQKQYKIYGILASAMVSHDSILALKKFQREKSPEWLGKAISINPYLLEHPLIRAQVIVWINKMGGWEKTTKEAKKNITLFVKGLIPKAVRQPIRLKAILDTKDLPAAIKTVYHEFRKDIQEEFDKFKEQQGKKPKHQGDIAPILKRIFKKPGSEFENESTVNQFLEEVANKKKEKPSEIALLILQEALRENGYNIGTRLLKKLIFR